MERGLRPDVSARDLETVRRLRNRLGPERLIDIVRSLPLDPTRTNRRRGAPPQAKLRQSFYAALYLIKGRVVNGRHRSLSSFASDINRVVVVRYGRINMAGGVNYKTNVSRAAVEQDLRRGLNSNDEKLIQYMIQGLIWWRYKSVNPKWIFLVGGVSPNLLIEPIKPNVLIQWIDAALHCAGVHAEIERNFTKVRDRSQSELADVQRKSDK
jgi:hypothetical protein